MVYRLASYLRRLTLPLLLIVAALASGLTPYAANPAAAAPANAPSTTWFFAEGSTQSPFQTWFLVQNANSQPTTVTFTFFLQPSGTATETFIVGANSRFSLFANQSLPNAAFSTRITSTLPIAAERAMYVSYDGDAKAGVNAPNTTWLFAEGSTQSPFQTWILLQNPNSNIATATVQYLQENGQVVTQVQPLPPNSRTSIFVNQVLPNSAFSIRITSDLPIIAERSLFRFPGNAATDVVGINAPAPNWFFAEGRTNLLNRNADTFLLLQNPNSNAVNATVTLFSTTGQTTQFVTTIAPTSRQTIFMTPIVTSAGFATGSFGIRVQATGNIIAERSIFFGVSPTLGAISTLGSTTLATAWDLAEGETRAPFDERILILNPNAQATNVTINFQLENGQVVPAFFTVGANSKLEVEVGRIVTGANSARITSSLPTVVERVMLIHKLGVIGGTDVVAVPGS